MTMNLCVSALAAAALIGLPASASANVVRLGQYSVNQCCSTSDGPQTSAVANGLEYVGEVSPLYLSGIGVIVAGRFDDAFTSWIAAGGAFIFHDWSASQANTLPGMAQVTEGPDVARSNIDVLAPDHAIVSGPFGILDGTSMDGGNFSNHGAVSLASLISDDPAVTDLTALLGNGHPNAVTEFSYRYGAGLVIYASMPTDAYTGSHPFATPGTDGLAILGKNEVAYAARLARTASVAEPASLGLLGAGFAAWIGLRTRRGSRQTSCHGKMPRTVGRT